MNDKFDELSKGLAQSVTRRGALKKFGVGLAFTALAALGLTNAKAGNQQWRCDCSLPYYGCKTKACIRYCAPSC